MKDLKLLAWLTQLGFSVASPLAVCILGAVWLRQRFHWGIWIVILGIVLGFGGALSGFLSALRTINRNSKSPEKPPPPSFNEHDG